MFLLENGKIDFDKPGTFLILTADEPALSGFTYPVETLRGLVNTFEPGMGELKSSDPISKTLNLSNVSHLVTELWFDELTNGLYARIKILDTPMGNIIKSLMQYHADGLCRNAVSFRLASEAKILEGDKLGSDIKYLQIFADASEPSPSIRA